MAAEPKSEETIMAQAEVSQEKEPSKNVKDKDVVATGDNKAGEDHTESNKDGEPKADDVEEEKKKVEAHEKGDTSSSNINEKTDSIKEESNFPCDIKENEKKALIEFRSKIEEAILTNKLFKEPKEEVDNAKSNEQEQPKEIGEDKEKHAQQDEEKREEKEPENYAGNEGEKKAKIGKEKEKVDEGGMIKDKINKTVGEKPVEINKDIISLWGVPLLPSKGDQGTDVILLKFLRARDFNVNEAFEMLRNTIQWRKESKIDSILDEDFGADYDSVVYMSGVDLEGHPVCYNIYGVFGEDELYNKAFGTEESREKFLRWRLQLMEKEIQKLDVVKPGGVSSLLQINDLKNTPGPSRKDLRLATKQAVALLQDNYPEFVARNIFVNVPFWYYAFNALLSPFLTQRTKSKFVFTRPARVTETLLKYIAIEEIPVQYGGLKRDNDSEFSTKDAVSEVTVMAGSSETVEIPAPVAGTTLVWDLSVLGWEVNYKEEFIPTDEGSYSIIVRRERRMGWQETSVRNSFRNNEPGKVVLTIENGSFKKKRVFYRSNKTSSSSS